MSALTGTARFQYQGQADPRVGEAHVALLLAGQLAAEVQARAEGDAGLFEGGAAQVQTFLQSQQALWARVVRERRITRD